MKQRTKHHYFLLYSILFSFFSCIQFENNESCLDYITTTAITGVESVKLNTSQTTTYEFLNNCNSYATVLYVKIDGENKTEFRIEGITENSEILEKGTSFSIIFTPRTAGDKKATIFIKTNVSDFVFYMNGKGIY